MKPDVAAPGDTISLGRHGHRATALTISGTSMASPVTAGVAALVRAAHPSWNAARVKAAVMNTAGHDVYTEPGEGSPVRPGPGRGRPRRRARRRADQ